MKKILASVLAILMLASMLSLVSCQPIDDDTTTTTAAPDNNGEGSGTTAKKDENPDPTPTNPTYTIKFVDASGNGVSGVKIQCCNALGCVPIAGSSNAEGVITITTLKERNDWKVQINALPDGYEAVGADADGYFHFPTGEKTLTITLSETAA